MTKVQNISHLKITFSKTKKVAVIGFGAQGKVQALNLKDSGFHVLIGLPLNSKSIEKAKNEGFEVMETGKACKEADIVLLLAPDELHGQIFEESIKPNFKKGSSIITSHGFSFHFGYVKGFHEYNIGMVAPKGISTAVRESYINKKGVFSLLSVFYKINDDIDDILLQIAKGIGAFKVMNTTFKEECETDLFGEQAVLCGGVIELFSKAFETLVENGYNAEISYFECVQELKFIADLIFEKGLSKMFDTISNTAKFGGLNAGKTLIDDSIKEKMKGLLSEIQNGNFARKFIKASLEEKYAFKEEISKKYDKSSIEAAAREVINILK